MTPSAVHVDVIVPVHNAALTIEEAVTSAMHQEIPSSSKFDCFRSDGNTYDRDGDSENCCKYRLSVTVCCYDDGSTDQSLAILSQLQERYDHATADASAPTILSHLRVHSAVDGQAQSRGAGYARNRAIEMNNQQDDTKNNNNKNNIKFLCLLDSDDIMHPHRVAEQALCMLALDETERHQTLLGCTFLRDPPDATWHYANWANRLSNERLMLERFREVTILQPTWFLTYQRWAQVGPYIEAPPPPQTSPPPLGGSQETAQNVLDQYQLEHPGTFCLIHPVFDTLESLRLAEDLRFFMSHLYAEGRIMLLRTTTPLVSYRQLSTSSQSFRTSRMLLLQLRCRAFEEMVLRKDPTWGRFVIWGAGRDGKDFFKNLSDDLKRRVYCFVDVDVKKLNSGYYVIHKDKVKIPIVHFSFLAEYDDTRQRLQMEWENGGAARDAVCGRIDKSRDGIITQTPVEPPKPKKAKTEINKPMAKLKDRGLNHNLLQTLPVVVCVAMYRTNGVLERNVASINRTEGKTLWHFS